MTKVSLFKCGLLNVRMVLTVKVSVLIRAFVPEVKFFMIQEESGITDIQNFKTA